MTVQEYPELENIIADDEKFYLNAFGRRMPICLVKGEGIWVYDSEGHKYADLIGGIAVNVLGHAHPRLVKAICSQAGRLIHCSNYYYNQPQTTLAGRLARIFQDGRVFFTNSGAEANETAIKLARGYFFHRRDPRAKIISAVRSFHGRTLAAATATGQPRYSAPFAPLPGGFVHVPFNDIDAMRKAIDDTTCAVILELIQGESGVFPANGSYIREVAALCRKTGARLIFDEIQTGMGRTGRFFAYEHYDVKPNIATLAKGLAGGIPIGATLADEETATGFTPGDHGSTFGGNPLACSAALAVLDEYEAGELVEKARETGDFLLAQLNELQARTSLVADIRGLGLMAGIEFSVPIAADIKQELQARGYLVGAVGDSVIRLLPPLIITRQDLSSFISDLDDCLKEASV